MKTISFLKHKKILIRQNLIPFIINSKHNLKDDDCGKNSNKAQNSIIAHQKTRKKRVITKIG